MLLGSVFSHTANFVASTGYFAPLSTAVDEPPQLAAANCAPPHCGIGATRHLPEALGALPMRIASPHCALTQPTIWPSCRCLYQAFAKSGSVATSLSRMRPS